MVKTKIAYSHRLRQNHNFTLAIDCKCGKGWYAQTKEQISIRMIAAWTSEGLIHLKYMPKVGVTFSASWRGSEYTGRQGWVIPQWNLGHNMWCILWGWGSWCYLPWYGSWIRSGTGETWCSHGWRCDLDTAKLYRDGNQFNWVRLRMLGMQWLLWSPLVWCRCSLQ